MKKILISLLVSFMTAANAADTMVINVDANQSKFQVILPANPTTGYQWTIKKYDSSILKLVASKYLGPQSKLMGAGGQMQFTFQLIPGKTSPSRTEMLLKYAQPWEPEKGLMKSVSINFQNNSK